MLFQYESVIELKIQEVSTGKHHIGHCHSVHWLRAPSVYGNNKGNNNNKGIMLKTLKNNYWIKLKTSVTACHCCVTLICSLHCFAPSCEFIAGGTISGGMEEKKIKRNAMSRKNQGGCFIVFLHFDDLLFFFLPNVILQLASKCYCILLFFWVSKWEFLIPFFP